MKSSIKFSILFSLIYFFSIMKTFSQETTTSISYSDGNANKYEIKKRSIEYIPVKPEFSSSGIYDGGNAVKKKITKEEFLNIASMAWEIESANGSKITDRVKGSGKFSINSKEKSVAFIIGPESPQKASFENLLKAICGN